MKKTAGSRRTLGLAMIMKDEIDDLKRIVEDYGHIFDKIYITVTHEKTYNALCKSAVAELVDLSFFEWIDHFGKARLYNQKQIKTDYWMWIDLDDEIVGAEKIASVLEYMVKNNLDVIWFRYDYIPRETLSDPESLSWRERIVKNAPNLAWRDVAVHETLDESIQGEINEELRPGIIIKHRKTRDDFLKSHDRNQRILEKDWATAPTAVTGYYLGRTLAGLGEYEDAIEKLVFAAEKSEIIPVQFESWLNLCDCYFALTKYDKALDAANNAMTIDPDHPMPWFKKFMTYQAQGMRTAAMRCAETSLEKPAAGGRGLILTVDLSWYQYKAPFEIARAYLANNNAKRAYELYQKVKEIAPQYIEEQSAKMNTSWDEVFEGAYNSMHEQ